MLIFYLWNICQTEIVWKGKDSHQEKMIRLNFPLCFYIIHSCKGKKWEFDQFSFKEMFYKFYRACLNCIWILCSTPAWLFMMFIEYSHYSLPLCTFINTTFKRHLLRLMIYNWKQDVTSHAFTTITESCKSSWPTPTGPERSCHSTQEPKMLIRPQSPDFPMRFSVQGLSLYMHSLPLLTDQIQGLMIYSVVVIFSSFGINHHEGRKDANNLYCSPIQISVIF